MKRRIHVLLFVGLFSPFTVLVSQAATVDFNPAFTKVTPGTNFSIDVVGRGFTELSGGEFSLGYNDAVIEIMSVDIDPHWDYTPLAPGSKTGPGRWTGIAFDTFSNPAATGDFNIVTVNFKALGLGTPAVDILPGSQFFSTTAALSPTLGSANVQVVPVPAAVWLLGSGLMGLIGVARRRASAKTTA